MTGSVETAAYTKQGTSAPQEVVGGAIAFMQTLLCKEVANRCVATLFRGTISVHRGRGRGRGLSPVGASAHRVFNVWPTLEWLEALPHGLLTEPQADFALVACQTKQGAKA